MFFVPVSFHPCLGLGTGQSQKAPCSPTPGRFTMVNVALYIGQQLQKQKGSSMPGKVVVESM